MATVRINHYGRPVTDLPAVCMQCGAPAAVYKHKVFSWYPSWVYVLLLAGLLPFLLVAMILTKRRSVEAPLCPAHKHHWLKRQLGVLLGLAAVLALGFAALIGLTDEGGPEPWAGWLCTGVVLMLGGWVVVAAVVQTMTIRPREISDHTITLAGVCPEFVRAYEEERPRLPPLDDFVRERWNRPERRPSRPPAAEAEHIQPSDEDEGRESPPGSYRG